MVAFLSAWILISSIWTVFCIFDGFRGWIEFREWKATVSECKRESVVLLGLIMNEVREARERMRRNSGPCDLAPNVDEPESQRTDRGDAHGSPAR